ncbi:hypothetical protein ZIOFF_022662 [Zingiber officinale]|uniref:RNA polymerase II nuclear localization protein SLC7A6OS n=1 Tax=Zingiber officinale TaxID=94328 RepID=A0A8J5H5I8_ZINOF|nr:hypothetical protein ZIOFF_022662 [Zingiber officinale]
MSSNVALAKAIKEYEDLVRSARFEQIWKKRGSIDTEECSLHEKCHLYDVVRVDAEDETHQRVPKPKVAPEAGGAILDKYLPLLWEFLPQAAEAIEHDRATIEDNFVYDLYTTGVGVDIDTDNTDEYPLVQVYVEDDYYDGSSQSDYESDDSNVKRKIERTGDGDIAIVWAILVLRSILILRALTFDVSSVDQRKASSAEFHHRKAYCSEFDVSSVHHQKASSSEFHHWKVSSAEFHVSSAEFEHRKPSSAEFDYRKPSFAELDDKKPSSPEFDHKKPSSPEFDHKKPSSPEFDHRKPSSAGFVYRKASSAEFDHWKAGLEINERPHKKAFLGLGNLSLSDCGTGKGYQEDLSHGLSFSILVKGNDELLYNDLAKSARFEQIWKKRGSIDAEECSLHEKCHLYDVVRVDAEDETHQRVPKPKVAPEVGGAIFDKYLPLLKEFLPQAAEEIEHDRATTEDNFVYDIYTIGSGVDIDTDSIDEHPLIQVYVEDDYYDGSSQSDYESDDSNAENYPWNDYCDEESDFEYSDSIYDQSEEEDREDWRWGYR